MRTPLCTARLLSARRRRRERCFIEIDVALDEGWFYVEDNRRRRSPRLPSPWGSPSKSAVKPKRLRVGGQRQAPLPVNDEFRCFFDLAGESARARCPSPRRPWRNGIRRSAASEGTFGEYQTTWRSRHSGGRSGNRARLARIPYFFSHSSTASTIVSTNGMATISDRPGSQDARLLHLTR